MNSRAILKPPQPGSRGSGLKIGIVATRWNPTVIDALVEGSIQAIAKTGADYVVERVAGAYELPFGAQVPNRGGVGSSQVVLRMLWVFSGDTVLVGVFTELCSPCLGSQPSRQRRP